MENTKIIGEVQDAQILNIKNLKSDVCTYAINFDIVLLPTITVEGIKSPLVDNNCAYNLTHTITNPNTQ